MVLYLFQAANTKRINVTLLQALALALLFCTSYAAADSEQDAVPVELRKGDSGWQLFRDGAPYLIRGAGGNASLQVLAASGANSIRLWDTENAGPILDEAHSLGLTVAMGIWLGHERHGFDYTDQSQLDAQLEKVRDAVLRYRDHPAVLLWALGNEMEGFASGDNPAIWAHVNEAAALVKSLDTKHPTMTVTAEIGGARVPFVHQHSDAIDIHGINAYGGAASLAERLRAAGATKPYVLTEFGPPGGWEAARTEWGAPLEMTSTDKAAFYRKTYTKAILDNPQAALGSYAFVWGSKMEGTPTWFGMFTPTGERLAVVDTMQSLWTGQHAVSSVPVIERMDIDVKTTMPPNTTLTASVAVQSESAVTVTWSLLPESDDSVTGGDFRATPAPIEGAIVSTSDNQAVIKMPEYPGPYRLFAMVRDNNGGAATANTPVYVQGTVRTRFPVDVYREGLEGMPWAPSGWMGNTEALTIDGRDTSAPYDGDYALKVRYTGTFGWAAIGWQHPANNWGETDGGFDLTSATQLELWARGEYGGESVEFGVGLLGDDVEYADSTIARSDTIELTSEWRRYRIRLRGRNLSSLKTGFVLALTGRQTAVTVYLDNIRYVR